MPITSQWFPNNTRKILSPSGQHWQTQQSHGMFATSKLHYVGMRQNQPVHCTSNILALAKLLGSVNLVAPGVWAGQRRM